MSHVFAFHLSPDYPYGMIATKSGEFFASSIEFYVDIKGRSAHGAQPQNGKDSILIGAQLVTALHSMTMKDFSPLEDYLLHIGTFNGGDRLNIIAGRKRALRVLFVHLIKKHKQKSWKECKKYVKDMLYPPDQKSS